MTYEVQQAYRIFTCFLLEKHKGITSPFLHPVGHQEPQRGIGGVKGRGQSQLRQSMCLRRIEEKFTSQEYETITEFVTDFRLMLENCYRYHGVDHWISKQAQKLEIMLEQKLTLLSRTLREKTTLAVTSKGRFGTEEDRGTGGTSTRRRLAPRSLATLTVAGHESIMVQTLRVEEQQRAKEEKRQREQEKKEAEEMSAKEVDEWEQSLMAQASPQTVDTVWELPAIGHFLCLAQTALNLPEVVFFELERCLLMPRCSLLLSKIMSSLLSPPQRRATLHRRPALPYRRWESELRQRVMGWYRTVAAARDQPGRAAHLGLCHQFFSILGEVNPLEEKPFHLLPFSQRVWLLKGLCDHIYETQKDVQDAVLAQPIHECRESILGYDSKDNAYIHFPHFCGADLRIYCQSPSTPPAFPFPSLLVKRTERESGMVVEESDRMKDERDKNARDCSGFPVDRSSERDYFFKKEIKIEKEEATMLDIWSRMKEEGSESESSDSDSCEDSKMDFKIHPNSMHTTPSVGGEGNGGGVKINVKEETSHMKCHSKRLAIKQEQTCSLGSVRTIKAETQDPCLNVGEHSYTGRSPARSVTLPSPTKPSRPQAEEMTASQGLRKPACCRNKTSNIKDEEHSCCCGSSGLTAHLSSESTQNSSEERVSDKIGTKKKKRKKSRGREQLVRVKEEHKQLQQANRMRLFPAETAKSALRKVTTTIKKKDKKKKHRTGKKSESTKTVKDEPTFEPTFRLVCTNLEELRGLISKTEDELDDLESTKKKLGRWYYKKEAVKELHSTLIRLLNELTPWEPKLIKAYQRNRLRLKKEFDDFKKHPEYNNFVREECISSSSSDDEEERDLGKEVCSPSDHYGRSEEEDLEHKVPRGLWSGANTREFVADSTADKTVTCSPTNHLKQPLASLEKDVTMLARVQTASSNITTADCTSPSGTELISTNQFRNSAPVASLSEHLASSSSRPSILHTTGLPKGYTPIPTLLAKSVGNKVTLMKRPADCPEFNSVDGLNKGTLVSQPTFTFGNTKPSKAHRLPSDSQQSSQHGAPQTQALSHPETTTVTTALPKSPHVKPAETEKRSVPTVYKVSERLGHLIKKESSSSMFSVNPVMDHNTGEKALQQVVILPPNLLVQKPDAKLPTLKSKDIQVTDSKATTQFCMSTDVPGFSIPENQIPVQHVHPLKEAMAIRTPSPSVSPRLQQEAQSTAGVKGTHSLNTQANKPHITLNSPTTAALPNVPTESEKSTDAKQELKTVCIRDSQSILVTTRGGNTGIVRVQTSSDQNAFPTSPVITVSPQLKAFLLSMAATPPSSVPSLASSSTDPATTSNSVSQNQASSVLKPSSTVSSPIQTTVTNSIPAPDPVRNAAGVNVASSQGFCASVGSASKILLPAQTISAGSQIVASVAKTLAVPSPSRPGSHQGLSHEANKTGVKRPSMDEGSQAPKFILVTPSSSLPSNVALPRGTPSPTKSIPNSRVMFISQSTVASSTTSAGSIPKQTMTSNGQVMANSPSSAVEKGLTAGQPFGSIRGGQIQLAGKTTTIGQTIGALSSPSKCAPVSVSNTSCSSPATTTTAGPVTSPVTFTSFSSHGSLNTSSKLQGLLSLGGNSQTSCLTSTTHKDLGMSASLFNSGIDQVKPNVGSYQAQTSSSTFNSQPSLIQSNVGGGIPSPFKPQTAVSSAPPFTTSATAPVQQRIVINTSTPLAAGTQILLSNTRFVVPPQGLGPGSHVLIISSPAPQQVPPVSVSSPGTSLPFAGPATAAPWAPVLPQSPSRLPGVPAVSSPFVACTPAIGPSLPATPPHVMPVRLTGTSGLGSNASKTNVLSSLPRLSAGNIDSTLVSPPPKLSTVPALVPPGITSSPFFTSGLVRLASKTESTISPPVAQTFPLLPRPLLSVLPSPTSSAGAPIVAHTSALHCSVSAQQVVTTQGQDIHPQQTAGRLAAATTTQALTHTGLCSTTIKKPLIHPVFSVTCTLPTSTVPTVSTISGTQTTPIATVPPNLVNTMKTHNTIHPPVLLFSQGFGRHMPQTSAMAANIPSKLLISPDGAVLSTVQSNIAPTEMSACSKPSDTPAISTKTFSGAQQTCDSSLQPSKTDTK